MSFDFASGLTRAHEEKVIDPEEIFRRQTSGKNLWLGQGDVLRDWFSNRNKSDILIGMDTGMGKTIVGLLIAHSIMNEKNQKVIYVCASKQLVDQTVSEANALGIKVASYMNREYVNGFEFHECTAPLVTTYQALFNGKSKFFNEDIGGLIFDDSHVADNILKDSFTLSIDRKHELYTKIAILFESYFHNVKQDARFKQVLENKNDEVFILPPFEVKNYLDIIKGYFTEHKIDEDLNMLFAWEYLKDNLDMCLFMLSKRRIEITPPILPSKALSYFQEGISRVYLSATHVSADYFPRYYGNKIAHSISFPSGKSKSKKFIISPYRTQIEFDNTQAIRKKLIELLGSFKALIITPAFYRAEQWKKIDDADILEADAKNIIEKIEEFKVSDKKKLILANRYDGIDFPGDTCRVLILDGLPLEGALLDSYFINQMKADNYIRTEMNAKILQGMGRIFRGTDDYGIIFIVGEQEIKWINTPKNLINFPPQMQTQLKVGSKLNSMITNESFESLIYQVLSKDAGLMGAYEKFVDEEMSTIPAPDLEQLEKEQKKMEKISSIESHLLSALWLRDYEHIEALCSDLLENSREYDTGIYAWHCFIQGLALQVLGRDESSTASFIEANRLSHVTPKPFLDATKSFPESDSGIVNSIIEAVSNMPQDVQLARLQDEFKYLDNTIFKGEDKKHELGIEYLGKVLGFDTDRPDNRLKTGPDVLWKTQNNQFVIFELKTNKTTGPYAKKETGQFLDHVEWIKSSQKVAEVNILHKIIVGPHNKVNHDANPSDDIYVIELEEFKKYAEDIVNTVKACYGPTINTTERIEHLVETNALEWTNRFDKMSKMLAIELKDVQ